MELHKINPATYFLVGQVSSLVPYCFLNSRVFTIYNVEIGFLLVYLTFFSATFFYFVTWAVSKIRMRRVKNYKKINVTSPNKIILFMVLISILTQLFVYGGSPLLSIIRNPSSIVSINSKVSDMPGLLGIALLCNQLMILTVILSIRKKMNLLIIIASLFSVTMSAKRQLLLVLIIAYSSRKKMRWQNIVFALGSAILLFSSIGVIRGSRNLFEPIIFYLSYSTINFSLAVQSLEDYVAGFRGVFSSLTLSLPTVLRGQNSASIYSMAEPTAGFSLVGGTFLNSGGLGLVSVIFTIAMFTSYLWRQAQHNDFFRILYIFSIWPLVSSNTYNLFFNVSFYLLPLTLFFIFILILPKRRHKI